MCSNLVKLLRLSLPFLDRQRGRCAKSRGELRPRSGWGKRTLKCLKWSHVRSGVGIPPSMKQGGREQWQTAGCGLRHSRKGEVRVTKGFVDKGKVREKTGNRTPKASKAITKLNYFSRGAIKRYSIFPHWITESDSWKSLPTHTCIWPWDTSVSPPRKKKKKLLISFV